MSTSLTKEKISLPKKGLIGLKFSDFERLINANNDGQSGLIVSRKARLIPSYKTGDELHLASVTLAAMDLIKEFRDKLYSDIGFKRQGSHHFYTEVGLKDERGDVKYRFDGLILQVIRGEIRDAVFFEFKGNDSPIDSIQIENYLSFIKDNFKTNKLVTVSPQFVTDPSHIPYEVNKSKAKKFKLSHFSWSYIKMVAHLLLFDNNDNIEDVDQINLMKEVLDYYEDEKIGLKSFGSMSDGWSKVVKSIQNGTRADKEDLKDAVVSWIQEQTDMTHLLSKHLGVMVRAKSLKSLKVDNLENRIKNEISTLSKEKSLSFDLEIKSSFSDINVLADFETDTISMVVSITPPLLSDKKSKGRLSWMLKQFEKCQKFDELNFNEMKKNIFIETRQKHFKSRFRANIMNFSEVHTQIDLSKDIVEFSVVYQRDLKGKFQSGKGFVREIEKMLLDYYSVMVQNLSSWQRPQPKMSNGEE